MTVMTMVTVFPEPLRGVSHRDLADETEAQRVDWQEALNERVAILVHDGQVPAEETVRPPGGPRSRTCKRIGRRPGFDRPAGVAASRPPS